jgi:hypothetical protein
MQRQPVGDHQGGVEGAALDLVQQDGPVALWGWGGGGMEGDDDGGGWLMGGMGA